MTDAADFFCCRLDQMIDPLHPLAILASRMPWQEFEAGMASLLANRDHFGNRIEGPDFFGPVSGIANPGSSGGRPRISLRLMISLLSVKYAFNESDEGVVESGSETPTWQYFSGFAYFEHRSPCDPTTLIKFRKAIGEEGVEEFLAQTISVAFNLKLISAKHLETVIIDTAVQPKAVAHPTDSKLLEVARDNLVEIAEVNAIPLKQMFAKEGSALRFQAGRYKHARQFQRMRKAVKRLCCTQTPLCHRVEDDYAE